MSLLGLSAYASSDEDDSDGIPEVPIRNSVSVLTKKKEKVKIMAPSLQTPREDDDQDEPPRKKKQVSASTSLFSKLPAPKNMVGRGKEANRALIPHVFRRKPEEKKPPSNKTLNSKSTTKSTTTNKTNNTSKTVVADDEDEGDEPVTNFFSFVDKTEDAKLLADTVSTPEASQMHNATDSNISSNESTPSYFNSHQYDHSAHTTASSPYVTGQSTVSYNYSYNAHQSTHTTTAPSPQSSATQQTSDSWIDPQELMRLSGRRGKKDREQIQFIDVNADSALEGNKELLLKQISEEKNMNRTSHSKKKNKDMPSSQQKRKHQLSYLIHQAKAREVELKQSWAEGKTKRDVVKTRYGF